MAMRFVRQAPGRCPVRSNAIVLIGLVVSTDIEVVKATFAAFANRDLDTVLALVDQDVELTAVTGEEAGRTRPYVGYDGMREYFRDVGAVWEELRLTPREFRSVGDLILVTGRVSARSKSRTVTGSTGWVWRVRDGKIVYVRAYPSAADAIAAIESDEL
jgi:ketosteroid isomerase-like protein